jgi:hypothetical protein
MGTGNPVSWWSFEEAAKAAAVSAHKYYYRLVTIKNG